MRYEQVQKDDLLVDEWKIRFKLSILPLEVEGGMKFLLKILLFPVDE